jgi:hypothetical protein
MTRGYADPDAIHVARNYAEFEVITGGWATESWNGGLRGCSH